MLLEIENGDEEWYPGKEERNSMHVKAKKVRKKTRCGERGSVFGFWLVISLLLTPEGNL